MHANDSLHHFNGTDNYCRYLFGMLATDGAMAFADKFRAYWLLDIVASYYPQLKEEEFQEWQLKVMEDRSAVVRCTNGNKKRLIVQEVPFTDFSANTATLWVEGNVILLPSEH